MKTRVRRSLPHLVSALDDNLFLLRRTLSDLRDDAAHFKVLVAQLRTLVCLSSRTEGLLWRVADTLQVSDEVRFHGVGGVKLDHPLARGLRLQVSPIAHLGEGPPGMPVLQIPLRRYVKECEASFFAGKGLTWENTIRWCSEQLGVNHESDDIELHLVALEEWPIAQQALQQAMVTLSELSLRVGETLMAEAERQLGYVRRSRGRHGQSSVFLAGRVFELPLSPVSLCNVVSVVSGARVAFEVGPAGIIVRVTPPAGEPVDLILRARCEGAVAICLRYSSVAREVSACMTNWHDVDVQTAPMSLNLGWIEPTEWHLREAASTAAARCDGIGIHKDRLSTADLRDLMKPAV